MKSVIILCLFLTRLCFQSYSQQVQLLTQNKNTSFRGLSVVDDQTIWVSGSQGMVGKSLDGGSVWQWIKVKNYENRDFRDIEAFDGQRAIVMAVDAPAVILKTMDGGRSWRLVFSDSTRGMFLDAMDFADENHGLVIGDPINNKVFMASTDNGGENWKKLSNGSPALAEGEAFFAASGSNVKYQKNQKGNYEALYVSGGKKSRLWTYGSRQWNDSLPIQQGAESTGANSLATVDLLNGIVVGGDFSKAKNASDNCVLFSLSSEYQFRKPNEGPHGYRSCVIYLTKDILLCCGLNGADLSSDGGMNWKLISPDSFNTCQKAKNGNAVFLAGSQGKIFKLIGL
ncbi:MAG: WD40/YVTN/BNR-like repeat-containing protein [Chitinophagales bacterium]